MAVRRGSQMGAAASAYSSFTPGAPTGVTTNPSLGTGPIQTGQKRNDGFHVEADVYYKVGSSPSAGSGGYRFPLPVPIGGTVIPGQVVGSGWIYDNAGSGVSTVVALAVDANTYKLFKTSSTAFEIGSTVLPFVAANEIGLHLSYRVA